MLLSCDWLKLRTLCIIPRTIGKYDNKSKTILNIDLFTKTSLLLIFTILWLSAQAFTAIALFFSSLIKTTSIDKGITQFKNAIFIDKDGYDFNGFEQNLNTIGYNYISNGDLISAVKILKFTTEQFPNSANAHDSLGEAYLKNNQLDLALQHYTKSYELDPKNENAKKRIEEIHKLK